MEELINKFTEEKQCKHKGEIYSVRDNGAVMRHFREGKKVRKDDGIWTFGKKDDQTGYMYIGTHRVHIIVATAFYGSRDSKVYVVDHIDTNRCNNRAENLRWLTRLENVLLNPITQKRVAFNCGSIENFIKNPSCLSVTKESKDLEWMRTVTPEEAANAYKNIMALTAKPLENKEKNTEKLEVKKSDWIFEKINHTNHKTLETTSFIKAISPKTALQMNWKTPTVFPCCPAEFKNNGVMDYYNQMETGGVFSINQYCAYVILEKALIDNDSAILVISKNTAFDAVKPYSLVEIYYSGGQYIHKSIQLFFKENGVKKRFTEMQGLKWEGEDSIDNYC
ncbi:MAG: HNH endonuclease [Salinivirgaceae bacterium]|nr:HNH endonuclease [Salinivirgaceae bacterium]